MASESTDEPVSIALPPDLAEWVDEQAGERDADRETVVRQLLAAHRAATRLDGTAGTDDDPIESAVRDVLAERLPDIVAAVADDVDVEARVEAALADERETIAREAAERASEEVTDQLDSRTAALEDDYTELVEDVRERVIQVKRETDAKAPADHDHPELADRIDAVDAEIDEVRESLASVTDRVESDLDQQSEEIAELSASLSQARDRLQTLAHVVADLRSDATDDRRASVDALKRRAAELDARAAVCESCGATVDVALLTEPECPDCGAAVTDVEPGRRFFNKPRLVRAQSIEAADARGR
ncbi:MAG: hypothetical protein ABEJ31_11670 [Haloarculaceae archaeon]